MKILEGQEIEVYSIDGEYEVKKYEAKFIKFSLYGADEHYGSDASMILLKNDGTFKNELVGNCKLKNMNKEYVDFKVVNEIWNQTKEGFKKDLKK